MSLDALLLEKLANWRPDKDRETLAVGDTAGGWRAAVTAEHVDVVGCRLWELTLRRTTEASAVELPAHAQQVCERATGLLEPLCVVEVDDPRQMALLRSEQPGQRGDERFYYEVLLDGNGGATVRRYQTPHAGEPRRQQVGFTLTHEALAKLVRDLIQ
ncbi:MAG TPA: hypothetical protein VMG10_07675 [Gemmataceae bacterium]|nr:hypothetical protein [Gemmataceae bacterium]